MTTVERMCEAFVDYAKSNGCVFIQNDWRDQIDNVLIDGDFDFGGAMRAAIAAMREPTPGMRAAVLEAMTNAAQRDPKVAAWDWQTGHRAAIDAALAEREG